MIFTGKLALCREERSRIMDGLSGTRPSTAPVSTRKPTVSKTKRSPAASRSTLIKKSKLVGKKRLSKSGICV